MGVVQPWNGWGDESGMMLLISSHLPQTVGNENLQTMYAEYSMMICCSMAQIKTITPRPPTFIFFKRKN